MDRLPVAVGETLAGKYRIDGVLGQGGMGVVVAATQLDLDRKVAIKFLLPDHADDADVGERFLREAKVLAKLEGEHVARVFDFGRLETGGAYMVMEHLEGKDLSRLQRERKVLPIPQVVGWVLEACEGIAEAHAAGIVHRDLKPANLFLAHRANTSKSLVKVLDFGISKSLTAAHALTATKGMLGSPLYMAPEQVEGSKDADARTDVWGLGVILYELATGKSPFLAESLGSLVQTILHETPPSPDTIRGDMDPALAAVIMRCLAKKREDRWPGVAELASALAPHATAGTGAGGVSTLAVTTTPGGAPPPARDLPPPPPPPPPPPAPPPGPPRAAKSSGAVKALLVAGISIGVGLVIIFGLVRYYLDSREASHITTSGSSTVSVGDSPVKPPEPAKTHAGATARDVKVAPPVPPTPAPPRASGRATPGD